MLDVLPNIREALLIVSGFFAVMCVIIIGFTAFSKAVQSERYLFSNGQWIGFVGLFVFGLIFGFGWSLPTPLEAAKTPTEQRAALFNTYYDECKDSAKKLGTNDNNTLSDCTITANNRADIAMGTKPVAAKVVWINPNVAVKLAASKREARTEKFKAFYDDCVISRLAGESNQRSQAQLNYCTQLADQQTDTAFGDAHVVRTITKTVYRERPNTYAEAFKMCNDFAVDQGPNGVQQRNDRIKFCHAQATEVVAKRM